MKIASGNNEHGTILNTGNKSSLNITTEGTEIIDLKNKIDGKFNLVKKGDGKLKLSNEENTLYELPEITVEDGSLIYEKDKAHSNAKINLVQNGSLEIKENNVSSTIDFNGKGIHLDKSLKNQNVNIGKLHLKKDLEISGYEGVKDMDIFDSKTVNYNNLSLNGKKLTISDQFINLNNISSKGTIEIKNSKLRATGERTVYRKNNLEKLIVNNSFVHINDLKHMSSIERGQEDKEITNYTPFEIKGESIFETSAKDGNAGGVPIVLTQDIDIKENATLTINSFNKRWDPNILLESKVTGTGNLRIGSSYQYDRPDLGIVKTVEIKHNLKDFQGTLGANPATKDLDIKFNINKESEEDRTVNVKMVDGTFTNISGKKIFYTNLDTFTGTIKSGNANIGLKGNGLNASGNIYLHNDKKLEIVTNQPETLSGNLNISTDKVKLSKPSFIKQGDSSLTLGKNIRFDKTYIGVEEGELILKKDNYTKDSSVSKMIYYPNSKAMITLDFDQEETVNSKFDSILDPSSKDFTEYFATKKIKQKGKKVKFALDNAQFLKEDFKSGLELIVDSEIDVSANDLDPRKHKNTLDKLSGAGKLNLFNNKFNEGNIDTNIATINRYDIADMSEFKGTYNLDKVGLNVKVPNEEVDSKVIGNGALFNTSDHDLSFEKVDEFTGTLVGENGGIILKDKGLDTAAKVHLKNDKNLTLKATKDTEIVKNLQVSSETTDSKIIKTGTASVSLGDGLSVENIKKIELEAGELIIKKDNYTKKAQSDLEYDLKDNSTLTLDFTKENEEIHSVYQDTGENATLKQKGKKVAVKLEKIANIDNIQIDSEMDLSANSYDAALNNNILGKGVLTLKNLDFNQGTNLDETKKFNATKISDFAGTLALDKVGLQINDIAESGKLAANIQGNGDLYNNTGKNITFDNLEAFQGNLHSTNGDVTLSGKKKAGVKKYFVEKGDIIFAHSTDMDMSDKTFENTLGTHKVVKDGNHNLVLNTTQLDAIQNMEIRNGALSINQGNSTSAVFSGNGSLKNMSSNNLSLENLETFEGSLHSTKGDITLTGNKKPGVSKYSIENGDIIFQHNIDMNLSDKTFENTSGSHKLVKDGANSLVLNTTQLDAIQNMEIRNGALSINQGNTTRAKLSGNGELKNISSNNINLDHLEDFHGALYSTKSSFTVNGDNHPGVTKYVIENGDILFKHTMDMNLNDREFENRGSSQFVKLGSGNLSLHERKLEEIKNLKIEEGNLNLESSDANRVIASNIHIAEGSSLTPNTDSKVASIFNEGKIILKDRNFGIENYKNGENSSVDITLTGMNKKELTISHSEDNHPLTFHLDISEELQKDVIDNHELTIANLSNPVRVSNFKTASPLYSFALVKKGEKAVLMSHKDEVSLNNLYFLNELNLINAMRDEASFKTGVNVSYIHYKKSDREKAEFNNTIYQNSLSANGTKVSMEYVKKYGNLDFMIGLNYKSIKNHLNTNVLIEDQQKQVKSRFNINHVSPQIGIQYKNFAVKGELGYVEARLSKNEEQHTDSVSLKFLRHNLDFGMKHGVQLNQDLSLEYMANIGYVYSPLIKENVFEKHQIHVKNSHPFALYTSLGAKLKHKNVATYLKLNYDYSFAKIKLEHQGNALENTFNDKKRFDMQWGVEANLTENITLNTDLKVKLNRGRFHNRLFQVGLKYSW